MGKFSIFIFIVKEKVAP